MNFCKTHSSYTSGAGWGADNKTRTVVCSTELSFAVQHCCLEDSILTLGSTACGDIKAVMSSLRPRTRDADSRNAGSQGGKAALVDALTEEVERQKQTAAHLLAGSGQSQHKAASGSASSRPPSKTFFSEVGEECTSAKVKSFLYNVRKAGAFSNYNEERMIALAECYFTDAAAT